MKNIKYIIVALSVVFLSGCDDEDRFTLESFENGGFVKFVTMPEFDIGSVPSEAAFSGMVEDPSNNVAQYDLFVTSTFDGAPTDPILFASTQSFPFDIGFSVDDMAALFEVSVDVFEENDNFDFTGAATTDDGVVYTGEGPDFDFETGENSGGLTDSVLTSADGLLNALDFRVRLRDPQE